MSRTNPARTHTLHLNDLAAADLLVAKARAFGRAAHDSIGQRRNYTGDPYWIHTERVAEAVAINTGNPLLVAAGLLHDLEVDVAGRNPAFGLDAIRAEFGAEVAGLVSEMTDHYTPKSHPSFDFAQRKNLESERLRQFSDGAKTIRLADLADTMQDIAQHDPAFAEVYKREHAEGLGELRAPAIGGNQQLYEIAAAALGVSPKPAGPADGRLGR